MRSISTDTAPTRVGFNYDSVSPTVAKFLKGQANRILRTSSSAVIQVGKDLIAAKHYLPHGSFLVWVENEVGMRTRTAQAYMRVAQWASGKSATVAHSKRPEPPEVGLIGAGWVHRHSRATTR